jgi:hypothetical protein
MSRENQLGQSRAKARCMAQGGATAAIQMHIYTVSTRGRRVQASAFGALGGIVSVRILANRAPVRRSGVSAQSVNKGCTLVPLGPLKYRH